MNTTDITNTQHPPETPGDQISLPELSTTPFDEPQSPAVSQLESEGAPTETVLQLESHAPDADNTTTVGTKAESYRNENPSIPIEKVWTSLIAGVLSLFTISMAYAAFLSHAVVSNPVGPLVTVVILSVIDLVAFAWICTKKYRVTTTGALLPIFFSFIGGAMVILFFSVLQAAKNSLLTEVDLVAVLVSAAVFGGIGVGVTMGYLAFGRNKP